MSILTENTLGSALLFAFLILQPKKNDPCVGRTFPGVKPKGEIGSACFLPCKLLMQHTVIIQLVIREPVWNLLLRVIKIT